MPDKRKSCSTNLNDVAATSSKSSHPSASSVYEFSVQEDHVPCTVTPRSRKRATQYTHAAVRRVWKQDKLKPTSEFYSKRSTGKAKSTLLTHGINYKPPALPTSVSDHKPLKLKLCKDPYVIGSYRVVSLVADDNSALQLPIPTIRGSRSLRPAKNAKPVDSCVTTDSRTFRVGDIVWAKLTGYPFWPSRISDITRHPSGRASRECVARVEWFAWNQCSYISCHKLLDFLGNFPTKFNVRNKNRYYMDAVMEAKSCAEARQNASICHPANFPTPDSDPGAARPPSGSAPQHMTSHTSTTDPLSLSSATDLDHMDTGFDLPLDLSVTGAKNCLSSISNVHNLLPTELPDLGPLCVDVMKCDYPSFSDDDEDDHRAVYINPDKL